MFQSRRNRRYLRVSRSAPGFNPVYIAKIISFYPSPFPLSLLLAWYFKINYYALILHVSIIFSVLGPNTLLSPPLLSPYNSESSVRTVYTALAALHLQILWRSFENTSAHPIGSRAKQIRTACHYEPTCHSFVNVVLHRNRAQYFSSWCQPTSRASF